jgi:hypothetical protein
MKGMSFAVLFVLIGFAAAGAEVIIKPGHVYSSKCVVDYLKSKGCKDCEDCSAWKLYCENGGIYFGDIDKRYGGCHVKSYCGNSSPQALLVEAEASCAGK